MWKRATSADVGPTFLRHGTVHASSANFLVNGREKMRVPPWPIFALTFRSGASSNRAVDNRTSAYPLCTCGEQEEEYELGGRRGGAIGVDLLAILITDFQNFVAALHSILEVLGAH